MRPYANRSAASAARQIIAATRPASVRALTGPPGQVDPRWTPYIGTVVDLNIGHNPASEGRLRAAERVQQLADTVVTTYGGEN